MDSTTVFHKGQDFISKKPQFFSIDARPFLGMNPGNPLASTIHAEPLVFGKHSPGGTERNYPLKKRGRHHSRSLFNPSPRRPIRTGSPIFQDPTPRIVLKPKPGIIIVGFRGGKQHNHALRSQPLPCLPDQTFSNAPPLIFGIDGKIREIGDVGKIGQRTRNPHQTVPVPGRHREGGIGEHPLEDLRPVDRPSFPERGSPIKTDRLLQTDRGIVTIKNIHPRPLPPNDLQDRS